MVLQFQWDSPPEAQIIPGLDSWEAKIRAGLSALGGLFAAKLEAYAKSHAPWNDQTGAARQGLRAWSMAAASSVILMLAHSVFYGVFLELGTSRMAPRPIIMITLQAHYAEIMDYLRQLVGG